MKYFLDNEFIEDGKTIDLISIGIFAEDGRTLYLQNSECHFANASDWVWRNVFPKLEHFDLRGRRSCEGVGTQTFSTRELYKACRDPKCPWRPRYQIRDDVIAFCNVEKFGKPEFWGYYADYDWVTLCQLFGTMIELPKGFPMYCRDVKQFCDDLGNPRLSEYPPDLPEHHALNDALWTRNAYNFLARLANQQITAPASSSGELEPSERLAGAFPVLDRTLAAAPDPKSP